MSDRLRNAQNYVVMSGDARTDAPSTGTRGSVSSVADIQDSLAHVLESLQLPDRYEPL